MDPTIKAKWLKALRSGKFKQARGELYKGPKHLCCIGVGAVAVDKKFDAKNASTYEATVRLGLDTQQEAKLVNMNDSEKRTFRTIANFIEANY